MRRLGTRGRLLACIGIMCIGSANAGAPDEPTDRDWDTVAAALLAAVEHGRPSVVVLDDALPAAARQALGHLRQTTTVDRLPQRDKFELPPGAYLYVRRFAWQGGHVEFTATTGTIPKNAGLNCGVTENFSVKRDSRGAWQAPVSLSLSVC